jgi:hypothetical protein
VGLSGHGDLARFDTRSGRRIRVSGWGGGGIGVGLISLDTVMLGIFYDGGNGGRRSLQLGHVYSLLFGHAVEEKKLLIDESLMNVAI